MHHHWSTFCCNLFLQVIWFGYLLIISSCNLYQSFCLINVVPQISVRPRSQTKFFGCETFCPCLNIIIHHPLYIPWSSTQCVCHIHTLHYLPYSIAFSWSHRIVKACSQHHLTQLETKALSRSPTRHRRVLSRSICRCVSRWQAHSLQFRNKTRWSIVISYDPYSMDKCPMTLLSLCKSFTSYWMVHSNPTAPFNLTKCIYFIWEQPHFSTQFVVVYMNEDICAKKQALYIFCLI